ncbi:MAG TPA: prepilin-type N-terminal cleavage/methylation domain-containing protein [Gemmatimonadales bacterium]|nr:prepilin-type N-terminal cleavage/methylation domain-containing protein [Gemmatimonadales bacterium]
MRGRDLVRLGRRGFTLVELMLVTAVLSILASLALLKYIDLRNAAIATQMGQELRAIQIAAFNYYADQEQWPPETGAGAVPVGLGPLLPGQLAGSFDRTQYLLDYDNLGGDPDSSGVVIGVTVTTADPQLFNKFVQYLGTKSPFFVSGAKMTYLIAGPGGVF